MSEAISEPAAADNSGASFLAGDTAPAAPQNTTAPDAAPATQPGRDWLPPDLREHPGLAKFQDAAAVAKSYVELSAMLGKKLAPPAPDAPPEQMAAWRQAAGVPEKPDGYKIERPEDVPADMWDDEGVGFLREQAHALGMTPPQAQGLAASLARAAVAAAQREAAAVEQSLQREWGAQFAENVAYGNVAVRKFGGPELAAALAKSGANRDPAIVKAFALIGRAVSEDTPAGMSSPGGMLTPQTARAEWEAMVADRSGPYWNKMHPGHKSAVERGTLLHRVMAQN